MKRALFFAEDTSGAFQETLRTSVGQEEGGRHFAGQRTDEDDFNWAGRLRDPPELGEESAGEEEREVEVEVDCPPGITFRTLVDPVPFPERLYERG